MIKKNILLIAASALPYHIDKLLSFNGSAKMLTFASYQRPYVAIQKNQPLDHNDLEILFTNKEIDQVPKIFKKIKIFSSLIQRKEKYIFLSIGGAIRAHDLEIFFSVIVLRLLRKKVYITFDTNFLDKERSLLIELVKTFFLMPYIGALCSGPSSASYVRFLGFKKRPVVKFGFNTSDLKRYSQKIAHKPELRNNLLFIGRMSEKKNINFLIDVYIKYKKSLGDDALPLRLIGEGPNLQNYKDKVKESGLQSIYFLGVKDDQEIGLELSNARALLVPSLYEEWGFVVNEAVALSVPVVVSENVRAREVLIKQFVNGLIVEPTNLIGWVEALKMITKNEELYRNLSSPNEDIKKFADIIAYKEATEILIGHNPSKS